MVKRLIWTTEAQIDRRQIFEYWNKRNHSARYSRKLNRLFTENLKLICLYPEIGIKTDIPNVYKKTVRDYHIIYLNSTNGIFVLKIWDTRKNPDTLKYQGIV